MKNRKPFIFIRIIVVVIGGIYFTTQRETRSSSPGGWPRTRSSWSAEIQGRLQQLLVQEGDLVT